MQINLGALCTELQGIWKKVDNDLKKSIFVAVDLFIELSLLQLKMSHH
jgi:hypothetical protein